MQVYWQSFFIGNQSSSICQRCSNKLSLISGNVCEKCCKPSKGKLCSDCHQWDLLYSGADPLIKNISTYRYNEFMKDIVVKWKYRGDYELFNIFKQDILYSKEKFSQMDIKNASLVPIPLSKERLYERGFNQALPIANLFASRTWKVEHVLERSHSEKQSKKSRTERIMTNNPFKLRKKPNKNVILVDDIYTTGITLRHAANLLKQYGVTFIYSYSLIRG